MNQVRSEATSYLVIASLCRSFSYRRVVVEVAVGPTFWILQRTPAPLGAPFFTTSTPLGAELARARSQ